jgi:outer membrane protein OmpA-like peptidoglycan-associated protein
MYFRCVSAAFFISIAFASTGSSQTPFGASYSQDEVANFLAQQVDLGMSRAICVGTKEECAASKPAVKGFDMMLTFDLDSANLSDEARRNLDVIAAALQDSRLRAARFNVEGHTDARGRDTYNTSLSVNRANAVIDYLTHKNVPRDRLHGIGLGKTAPRNPDPFNPENRRVELKLNVE